MAVCHDEGMSTEQTAPRIVTPQEAQQWLAEAFADIDAGDGDPGVDGIRDLAHTVLTEPDRTRAAVVKELRGFADDCWGRGATWPYFNALARADAIENGADW